MDERVGNEPAFPGYEIMPSGVPARINGGLTKREYFAAMAMQGLCTGITPNGRPNPLAEQDLARDAVAIAYALLSELSKRQDAESFIRDFSRQEG